MKKSFLMMMVAATMLLCTAGYAKKQPVPKMYMFGVAAAFTDTIVHFTTIQELDSAWIDTKNNFLQERQAYSYQLRDYLEQQQQMPHRTCMVFYSQKREKLEKKFGKMMKLYTKSKDGLRHFDVRHLGLQDFTFTPVSAYVEVEALEE